MRVGILSKWRGLCRGGVTRLDRGTKRLGDTKQYYFSVIAIGDAGLESRARAWARFHSPESEGPQPFVAILVPFVPRLRREQFTAAANPV